MADLETQEPVERSDTDSESGDSGAGDAGKQEIGLPGWNRLLSCYACDYDLSDRDFNPSNSLALDDSIFGPKHKMPKIHDEARHWRQLRLSCLEVEMIGIMNQITDKTGWEAKVQDETIRQRWAVEAKKAIEPSANEGSAAVSSNSDGDGQTSGRPPLTDNTLQFCWDELMHKAERFEVEKYTTVLGTGAADIVKSDAVVPEDFRKRLVALIQELENDPRRVVDWHPGQENIVRNLVHPSLFPLYYGQSTFIPNETISLEAAWTYTGHGETLPLQDSILEAEMFSKNFQWLPAEVRFYGDRAEDGVRFDSYINNLEYPRYQKLYEALEMLIQYSIPLWNLCIATRMGLLPRRVPCNDEAKLWKRPDGPLPDPPDVFEDDAGHQFDLASELAYCDSDSEDQIDVYSEQKEKWKRKNREFIWPEPMAYEDFRTEVQKKPPVDLFEAYRERGLQVIVKIANIHLTPEKPRYDGGSWHVEGLANEHIAATAIFYYDSENITESLLSFRGGAMLPYPVIDYPQNDFKGLERVYGADLTDGTEVQDLATVTTPMGRLLAFPNVFQHCVAPFELEDKSKPGHRKIVVLWLVNPERRIISTAHVPPQQKEQTERYLRHFASAKGMPGELGDMIATANTGHLMSVDEAKKLRLRLMEERSVPGTEYATISRTYNFCEH